jgi:GNAT superfamily N-acetyltransferase
VAVGHSGAVTLQAKLDLRVQTTGAGDVCRDVLAALPHWFGRAESVEDYVAAARANPTVVATVGGRDVGLLTVVLHTPYAAEVYVTGVLPEYHRHGVGAAMLRRAEAWLVEHDFEFLQVKTLSPRREDWGYARTRAFYLAQGFRPLEEFPDLWDAENPALQMVKALPTDEAAARHGTTG